MRNMLNAVTKVNQFKGLLSEAIIVRTAKQTLNQYNRGWLKPETTELAEAIDEFGLRELLESPLYGRKLDAELTKRGIDWLRNMLFTKRGDHRCTIHTRESGIGHREYLIVERFSHFTFDGFYRDGYDNYVPTWRVHSKDGESFSYVCTLGAHNYNGYFLVMS